MGSRRCYVLKLLATIADGMWARGLGSVSQMDLPQTSNWKLLIQSSMNYILHSRQGFTPPTPFTNLFLSLIQAGHAFLTSLWMATCTLLAGEIQVELCLEISGKLLPSWYRNHPFCLLSISNLNIYAISRAAAAILQPGGNNSED